MLKERKYFRLSIILFVLASGHLVTLQSHEIGSNSYH